MSKLDTHYLDLYESKEDKYYEENEENKQFLREQQYWQYNRDDDEDHGTY